MKRAIILLILLMAGVSRAALDAAIVWEVRTTGAQVNGGGYKTGATGTDYSQQAAPQWANLAITAAGAGTTVTTASAAATMVGNVMYVVSGTNATVGWYEITAATPGVSFTVDRNWCTGAVANGVCNIGGAFLLGGTLDDEFADAIVAGNTVYFKTGTYTLVELIIPAATPSATSPITWIGYKTTRGDNPEGTDRPLIDCNGQQLRWGAYNKFMNLRFAQSNATYPAVYCNGGYVILVNVAATHTAADSAFFITTGYSQLIGCEGSAPLAASTEGAFEISSATSVFMTDCYAHDSTNGIYSTNGGLTVRDCIIETCQTGILLAASNATSITGCTIRGCTTGISGTTAYMVSAVNNIIADNYVGAAWTTATPINHWDYNCWSNNDTDVTNVTKGGNDVTADALLGSSIVEGADGATDGAGTAFTAASNPFSGVTTADYLNIVEAGTGATLGVYGISVVVGNGTLTLATSAGASKTGIDYKIVKGADFTISASSPCLNAGAQPGTNIGLTGTYPTNIGADQDDNTAAAASGGTGINKSGNKQ